MQVTVVSALAILITVGVYGLVAGIVKLDDLGLYLLRKSVSGSFNPLQRALGRAILVFAPWLMKALSVIGTLAMFLVGGGILTHSFSIFHHLSQQLEMWVSNALGTFISIIAPIIFDGIVGLFSGFVVLLMVHAVSKLRASN